MYITYIYTYIYIYIYMLHINEARRKTKGYFENGE